MTDQLLYFRIAEDSVSGSRNDKGIIERISPNPVQIFATEDIKKIILENPFQKIFLVDVDVQTVEGVPMLYRIIKLKEVFNR